MVNIKNMKRFAALTILVRGLLLVLWMSTGQSAFATGEKDKPLTNADVLKMIESRIPESVILAKIEASDVKFDTSMDAIIELNKKGVSEKVLNAMLKPKANSPATLRSPPPDRAGTVTPPGLPAQPPAVRSTDSPDTLSYGTATGLVKKGVTTQRELLELFGGPSVLTTDKDGTEVWMYDKTTSTVTGSAAHSGSSEQSMQSEASVMGAFFGIPLVGIGGGAMGSSKGQSAQSSHGTSTGTVTRSAKTITFIIKFNTNKTVKDYAVRQATY